MALTESTLDELSDCSTEDVTLAIRRLAGRFGKNGAFQSVVAQAIDGSGMAGAQTERRPFRQGLRRADDLPAAKPPEKIWFGLYRRSVVLLIGETGAGKSSLLYNIAVSAARNDALWRVDYGMNRPIRVLYIDPENAGNWDEGIGGQCAVKLARICEWLPTDLVFHDGRGVNLASALDLADLTDCVRSEHFDVLILDPIASLFNTSDENDNAEAARQMRALTTLSRDTGCCVVAVHHTGKDSHGNYGRGASARLAAADVGMVFRARGEQDEIDDDFEGYLHERSDVCRLQIVKSRLEGKASLFLSMAGEDRFERTSFEDWKASRPATARPRRSGEAAEEIQHLLADGRTLTRKQIGDDLENEDIGRNAIDQALAALVKTGTLVREIGPRNAHSYRLSSFPVSQPL